MSLARHQFTVQDGFGNILPGAHVEVRSELPGAPLASLFSDRAGIVAFGNPVDADANGYVYFHVIGGAYKIRSYTGSSGAPTNEHIDRYVGIGLNSESDSFTGVLDANALVVGGGTSPPSTIASLGTSTQVLHGNASGPPAFAAITGADLPNPSSTTLGGTFSLPVTSGNVLSGIGNDGTPTRAPTITTGASATLTGSSAGNALSVAQTWNTSGVPVGLKVAITDTAHGAGSQIAGYYGGVAGTTALWLLDTSGNTVQVGQHGVAVASTLASYAGRLGATTPAWQVDTSTSLGITGLKVTAQASGNGVNLTAIGETNVPIIINAAGSGTINFNTVGTGTNNFYTNVNVNHDSTPTLTFGTTGNTKGTLTSQGSGGFEFRNSSGNIIAAFVPVAATGQVNYPRFRSNSTTGGVILDAVGTDTDIGFSLVAKGGGSVLISTGSGTAQFQVLHTASANRWITVTGSNGGNPTINTIGGSLAITPGVVAASSVLSTSPTAGIGYATGSGGAVTQATSKATAVTLNTVTGAITMNNAALAAATIVSFVVNNSAIAATDFIGTAHESGGTTGAYTINARATGAGTAAIDVRNNTAGSLSEAIVIRFFVHKSVNS